MRAVLGVDGGNTKTDYLLHDLSGKLLHHMRAGTCSHEALGMEGAKREMDSRIRALLAHMGLTHDAIAAAAFGLAGVDQPVQQASMMGILHEIGIKNCIAMNDSFLGIKAGAESGIGICSINGTGTAAGGIDGNGRWQQVGGYGDLISGDMAGGSYLAKRTIGAVYDAIFRFGESTQLEAPMRALFGCATAEDYHTALSTEYVMGRRISAKEIIDVLFVTCLSGDAVAESIVRHTADALARSAAGCAVRLTFGDLIPVVLIGSVWTKGRFQPMIDCFKAQFEAYTKKACRLIVLEVPPAAGSVLWALELAHGGVPSGEVRETVIRETSAIEMS